MERHVRSFVDADDVIEMTGVRSEVVALGPAVVAHTVHEPGWRWSEVVRPAVGTPSCATRHVGFALRGRIHVVLDDGAEFDVPGGSVFDVPAGHDAWVVGDEPWESIEWMGARSWIPVAGSLAERILATVVMTDIVGSTEMASRLGATAWSDLIGSYEQAVREVLGRFRGHEVKMTGDGVLAMFDGAARAVRCGVALRAAGAHLGLETRTAVHTGEVELTEGDLHGVAIHACARMLAIAEPGEVVLSAITRDLVADAGFELADRGVHELRGLPDPVALFRVV